MYNTYRGDRMKKKKLLLRNIGFSGRACHDIDIKLSRSEEYWSIEKRNY